MTQPILCKYFAHGACDKGRRCTFSHDLHTGQSPQREPCKFFLAGKCTYGEKCINDHSKKSASRRSSRGASPAPNASRSGSALARQPPTRSSPATPLTPQHTPGHESPVPQDPPAKIAPSANTPRTVCNGFAMQRGCLMPDTCRLLHYLSDTFYNVLANNLEDPNPVCYMYFSQGDCRETGCPCRHQLTAREYQVIVVAGIQQPSARPAPPPPVAYYSLPPVPPNPFYLQQAMQYPGSYLSLPSPPASAPNLMRRKPCTYFAQGNCRRGETCTFSHDLGGIADAPQGRTTQREPEKPPSPVWGQPQPLSSWDGNATPAPDDTPAHSTGWGDDGWGGGDTAIEEGTPDAEPSQATNDEDTDQAASASWGQDVGGDEWNAKSWGQISTKDDVPVEIPEEEPEAGVVSALDGRTFGSVFNCLVLYGPGAIPERLVTSFDSRVLVLTNLPPTTSDEAINDLVAQYGQITDPIQVDFLDETPVTKVSLHDYKAAAHAAVALNGVEYKSGTLVAQVSDAPDLPLCADVPGFSRIIKISWPAPTKKVWLAYDSITKAKAKEAEINASLSIAGCKVKEATFERPKTGQTHSFMVTVTVPAALDEDAIKEAADCTLVHPNQPTYSGDPVKPLESELGRFGDVMLDVIPHDMVKARITAFATFATASSAARAVENMDKREFDFIGMKKMRVEEHYYIRYAVFSGMLKLVQRDVDALKAEYEKCNVTTDTESRAPEGLVVVRMGSKERDDFTRLRVQLDRLLLGEFFVQDGMLVWDDYFELESSQNALDALSRKYNAYIDRDFLHEGLRIHGAADRRDAAKKGILKLLSMVGSQQISIPVPRRAIRKLVMDGGLEKLYDAFDAKKIGLDLVMRTLLVRDLEAVERVKEMVDAMLPESSPAEDATLCGLCDLGILGEPVLLVCGHSYDHDCLSSLLKAYIRPRLSGLRCVAEGCDELITNDIHSRLLMDDEKNGLLESSLTSHLKGAFGDGFHLCPTTYCSVVYRDLQQAGTGIQCPYCSAWICTSCHVHFHEGLTCGEYQSFLGVGGDEKESQELDT